MSGSSAEVEEGFKKHFQNIKNAIEEKFPKEEVFLREKYEWTVLKGHRLKLTLISVNKDTSKETELAHHYVKIPKHVPEWITKKNLWHHSKEEIDLLQKLAETNGEKSPSKNTMETWKKILADNVRKTHHHQKQIPIPTIQ